MNHVNKAVLQAVCQVVVKAACKGPLERLNILDCKLAPQKAGVACKTDICRLLVMAGPALQSLSRICFEITAYIAASSVCRQLKGPVRQSCRRYSSLELVSIGRTHIESASNSCIPSCKLTLKRAEVSHQSSLAGAIHSLPRCRYFSCHGPHHNYMAPPCYPLTTPSSLWMHGTNCSLLSCG